MIWPAPMKRRIEVLSLTSDDRPASKWVGQCNMPPCERCGVNEALDVAVGLCQACVDATAKAIEEDRIDPGPGF